MEHAWERVEGWSEGDLRWLVRDQMGGELIEIRFDASDGDLTFDADRTGLETPKPGALEALDAMIAALQDCRAFIAARG